MTESEQEKEYISNVTPRINMFDIKGIIKGFTIDQLLKAYRDGYEQGKKIAEEKMRCCGNCKFDYDGVCSKTTHDECSRKDFSKWELLAPTEVK